MTADKTQNKPSRRRREPVQARSAETRAKILDVAYNVFAEKGYDTANTRDIAAAAGVTHTTIRYHFGSKDELWRETVRQMFARTRAELELSEEDLSQPAEERMKIYLRKYVYYCARNSNHARIMIAESVRGGERLNWIATNFIRPGHESILSLAKGALSDDIDELSIVSLLYSVVGMCHLPFVLSKEVKALYDIDITSKEAIETHIDTVVRLLFKT